MARKPAIIMVVVGLIATLAPMQSFAGPDQAVIQAWYEAAKAEGAGDYKYLYHHRHDCYFIIEPCTHHLHYDIGRLCQGRSFL